MSDIEFSCLNITVAVNRRKTDKYGQPYGWPANVYDKVENWASVEWMQINQGISAEEARERILDSGFNISKNISRTVLAKAYRINEKL